MIIDLATINFAGGGSGGGGGTPAPTVKLQEKTVGIMANGTTVIVPDAGYDGMYEVEVNVDVPTQGGGASGIDFSPIGYSAQFSNEINGVWNDDIAYSKTLYDAWDPTKTLLHSAFEGDTKLVFAPNVDTSNATSMFKMFKNCVNLTTVPVLNTATVNEMQYMFEGCKYLKEAPLFDTSNVTNMSGMFSECSFLTKVPSYNTTNVTNMETMFDYCTSLVTIPVLDATNVTSTRAMFYGCTSLVSVELNTVSATNMNSMFQDCKALKTANIKTDSATDVGYLFKNCEALESLPLLNFGKVTNLTQIFGLSNHTKLTELGGFKDLKIDWTGNYGLAKLPNLTYQSVMNVINNLYDFRGNGDSTTTRTIKFNANALAMLSDADKAIATNKGWILS